MRAILATLPFLLLGTSALAADATPERATTAEDAIRDFLNGMIGPSFKVGDKPIHLQPAGDHYDASANLGPGQPITATVHEKDAGIWTFDNLHYPIPLHIEFTVPSLVPNVPDSHLAYDIKAAEQEGAGTIDTTLATPSSTTASLRALDLILTGSDQSSTSHVGRGSGTTTLRPGTASGTLDLVSTSTMADYSVVGTTQTPEFTLNLRLDTDGLEVKTELDGLDPAKAQPMTRALAALLASIRRPATTTAGTGTDAPPFDMRAVHDLIGSLPGLAGAFTIDEAATRLRGVVNGFAFSLDHARIGMDARSPDGTMAMGMELETDGVTLPALAGTPLATFIPAKVELHPSVSGVNTHDFLAALSIATDPARPADAGPPPEFLALMNTPGLAAGIDSLEVDLGSSVMTGSGKMNMPSPGKYAGTGRIAVSGFDALTDQVKALPMASQALPAMLFAKGIGRTEGDRLVWDISYDGSKLLVNNVDILALGGGGNDGAGGSGTGSGAQGNSGPGNSGTGNGGTGNGGRGANPTHPAPRPNNRR